MNSRSKNKFKIRNLILFVIGAICILEIAILTTDYIGAKNGKSIAQLATEVIVKCKDRGYRPSCYDEEIPKLMDRISMEQAFEVTKIVQKEDQDYRYCHVLGHKLSAQEVAKDPSKWKDVLTRCPTTMCNNGCLHGGMMERFNSESLTDEQISQILPDLKTICEPRGDWKPVEVERSMCYHAVGHLNMFITNADIRKSTELCRVEGMKEDGRDYLQTCTQGVYMQVFQPLEPEDFALVKDLTPTRQTLAKFCDVYDEFNRGACYRESWPLFSEEILTPKGAIEFCSYSKDPIENKRCYSGLMSIITVRLAVVLDDVGKIHDYCSKLPAPYDSNCFGDAANRLLQIDPDYMSLAADICQSAINGGYSDSCYRNLVSYSKLALSPGSKYWKELCSRVPANIQAICISNYEEN